MTILRQIMTLLIVVLLSGCSSVQVNHDYDSNVDFSKYNTYGWLPLPSEAQVSQLTLKHIENAVERELELKGVKAASNNADMLIALHIGKQQQIQVVDRGYRYGRYGRGWGGGTDVYRYEEGTLILDFIDAGTKDLIWRGTATTVVEPGLDPDKRREKINKGIKDLLANFPPKK